MRNKTTTIKTTEITVKAAVMAAIKSLDSIGGVVWVFGALGVSVGFGVAV